MSKSGWTKTPLHLTGLLVLRKHVIQTLEGGTEEEAESRQDEVCKKVKAVVFCDITEDQFIAKEYEGPYDIIQCCLCLENACRDLALIATEEA